MDAFHGGEEINSTEDFKARLEIINEGRIGWTRWTCWEGKSTQDGKFTCCIENKTQNYEEGNNRPAQEVSINEELEQNYIEGEYRPVNDKKLRDVKQRAKETSFCK